MVDPGKWKSRAKRENGMSIKAIPVLFPAIGTERSSKKRSSTAHHKIVAGVATPLFMRMLPKAPTHQLTDVYGTRGRIRRVRIFPIRKRGLIPFTAPPPSDNQTVGVLGLLGFPLHTAAHPHSE